jgi:A/G-specific adenine glycosylase
MDQLKPRITMTSHEKAQFIEEIWNYYHENGRHDLPWRQPIADGTFDPYRIMVSELMLQQTQVSRVIGKYGAFLDHFPTVHDLARAQIGDVLREWQGLGYNRRAKYLWQAALRIDAMTQFPSTARDLTGLQGVGINTAGAIMAYAFNLPAIFIETNIRTVYIHHFFKDSDAITDREVVALVEQTVDHEHPREFYWALMDYGSYLKSSIGNLSKASMHYTKQSKFEGSRRQIRGLVIRALGKGPQTYVALAELVGDDRLNSVLDDLVTEGLIRARRGEYSL